MNLVNFNLDERIYIDANIFLYIILKNREYEHNCKKFLNSIEKGEIRGIISPLVIDEVTFKIIVENIKSHLKLESNISVLKKLDKQPSLIDITKPALITFLFIIKNYTGLNIVSVSSTTGIKIFSHITDNNLLPRDALHLSIMEQYNVKHIATNDPHFDKISSITVWKP